ncbi:uncharacterized protein [Venturia canescens]|uniref:uncharacterized protein n=1 Tax=Venturia canescens TaxID=32260 RepID=UPI001C9CBDBB|nr:uncharacterized protein LOC122410604 [Venturia canescens]XP_043275618.1 uncharacterized protein LOC122411130 [Venturia canescens]
MASLASIRDFVEEQEASDYPEKPACLPLKKIRDLEMFENLTAKEHRDVVTYLSHLGGSDANVCASLMLKEAMHERLAPKVNYHGRHQGTFALEQTKFVKVLYKAMGKTLRRPSIPLTEFSAAVTSALRAAKQRRRNKKNRRQNPVLPAMDLDNPG